MTTDILANSKISKFMLLYNIFKISYFIIIDWSIIIVNQTWLQNFKIILITNEETCHVIVKQEI